MDETQITLAMDFGHGSFDYTGWFGSEKLFGCRAYWDGNELWTRKGKIIQIPKFWKTKLPTDIHLDGEIFAGRKNFEAAYAATEHGEFTPDVRFIAFDCPSVTGNWLERMKKAESVTKGLEFSGIVESFIIGNFLIDAKRIIDLGGEGLIMRNPSVTTYEIGRSLNYLRVVFLDTQTKYHQMEMQNRWRLEKQPSLRKKLK